MAGPACQAYQATQRTCLRITRSTHLSKVATTAIFLTSSSCFPKDRILLSLDESHPEDDDLEGTVEEITTNDTDVKKYHQQYVCLIFKC